MKLDRDNVVRDAVHVRTWMLKLDRGERITIQPGSFDHSMIIGLVKYIEDVMRIMARVRKSRPGSLGYSNKAGAIHVRKMREKRRKKILGLIEKYFEIHGTDNNTKEKLPG